MKVNEAGAVKYQLFQDRNQGDELVMLEQYERLSLYFSPATRREHAETYPRFQNKAAYEAHNDSDHFKKVGKTVEEEGLLAKALEVKVLGALAGFANR